ncbi:MAG: methyltransferase domain-containing protein [Cyclobacteriaceae bacterium]|nr:methyltransferase domain-containing protein [Cyclobacteriaceae bacterium]
MDDLFGKAMLDFYTREGDMPLMLHTSYGDPEQVPLDQFFVEEDEFSDLEYFAMEQVRGSVLNIGAGSGRHSLAIQNRSHQVTALDISPACGTVMRLSGVKNIIQEDVFHFTGKKYDTLLMLMNGIGIAGNIAGVHTLLQHVKSMIKPGGQLLLDSSDIGYLYEETEKPTNQYYGEVTYRYAYKHKLGPPFQWIYLDQDTLREIANENGWFCQVIFEDESEAYLARLQLK